MSTPLASFFTKVGFDIDKTSLRALETTIGALEKRVKSMADSFSKVTNNSTVRAAAALANAEARRINAESKLVTQKLRLAGIEGKVAIANAKVQETANRLGIRKETTAGYFAKANASEMLLRAKSGFAADMAAVKESLDSGRQLRLKQSADEKLGRDLILLRKRNEVDESKLRRQLIKNQSEASKSSIKASNSVLATNARTANLVQRAATYQAQMQMKATPYARSVGTVRDPAIGGGFNVPASLGAVGGGLALQRFGQQAFNLGNIQMAQGPQFEFVTGSAEEAEKQIAFLNKEVDRLGLNLLDANVQYRQLFAAAGKTLGANDTQTLFTNFQNMATMLGLSTDAQNRGIRAFQQMISKGQVMA